MVDDVEKSLVAYGVVSEVAEVAGDGSSPGVTGKIRPSSHA